MFLIQPQRASAQSKPILSIGINLFLVLVFLFVAGCVPQVAEPSLPTSTPESVEPQPVRPTDTPIAPSPSPTPAASISYTFFPEIDASVRETEPDANLGDKSSLKVDVGTDSYDSYVRFTVPEIPGKVQRVFLRLYAMSNGSQDGPAVFSTDSSWSESEINWTNRPAHPENELDNKLMIDPLTWAEYDVTSAVTGQGTYDFVLSADSGDAVSFSSREGDWPPQLEVTFTPDAASAPASSMDDVTFVGAGDISMCDNDYDDATAALLDSIPGTVFTTGDNVYSDGTAEQFKDCYDPTWGRVKDRVKPVPGNHDYHTEGASAYYQYFNNVPEYYAYDLGNWRVYALNSDIDVSEDSPQVKWLKFDLATHPNQCVLAYWHVPRWSSGSTHGSSKAIQVLWKILYNAGAELILNGHEHNYERFTPMNAEGLADPQGLREIVIGTGGGKPYPFGDPLPTSDVRNSPIYGVLKLTLHSDSYDWEFVPVAGSTFTDSGSTECH